jgi:virginiamycin B lyase
MQLARRVVGATLLIGALTLSGALIARAEIEVDSFRVPRGSHPHDVAPTADGAVWYTAQHAGALGRLDPATGQTRQIPLGERSKPHSVVVGPDGALWVSDGGLNAILRVDPASEQVTTFALPSWRPFANLHNLAFDRAGMLWFTGQVGVYGRLDPQTGTVKLFRAPRGPGPSGMTRTPDGEIYFSSIAGDYIARVDPETGDAAVIDLPKPDLAPRRYVDPETGEIRVVQPATAQGPRMLAADSQGRLWVTKWHAGELGRYDPADGSWREWRLPGGAPEPYAVYVDAQDQIWLSEFNLDSIFRFDQLTETFHRVRLPRSNGRVRQLNGRPGEIWAAESGTDHLIVLRDLP